MPKKSGNKGKSSKGKGKASKRSSSKRTPLTRLEFYYLLLSKNLNKADRISQSLKDHPDWAMEPIPDTQEMQDDERIRPYIGQTPSFILISQPIVVSKGRTGNIRFLDALVSADNQCLNVRNIGGKHAGFTPLTYVCVYHPDLIPFMLQLGADPNQTAENVYIEWVFSRYIEITPLMIMAMHSNVERATELLDNGADVNALSTRITAGGKPHVSDVLRLAANLASLPLVTLLLARNAQVNPEEHELAEKITSPLVAAIAGYSVERKKEFEEVIGFLLACGARFDVVGNNSPLHEAAREPDPWVMERLLKETTAAAHIDQCIQINWGVNSPQICRTTPLATAVRNDNEAVVRVLCDASADPYGTPDDTDCSALMTACDKGHGAIVDMLLAAIKTSEKLSLARKRRAVQSAAMLVAQEGKVGLLVKLLDSELLSPDDTLDQITTKSIQTSGTDLLGLAAAWNQPEVVRCLMAHGANPFAKILPRRYFAAELAVLGGHEEVLAIMLHGQLPDDWRRLLASVVRLNHAHLIPIFCAAGADVNLQIQIGSREITFLMVAAVFGHVAAFKALLEAGANPNAETIIGSVLWNVLTGDVPIQFLELLLQHNVNLTQSLDSGRGDYYTAWFVALQRYPESPGLLHRLLVAQYPAAYEKMKPELKRGMLPLSAAVEADMGEVVTLFLNHGANPHVSNSVTKKTPFQLAEEMNLQSLFVARDKPEKKSNGESRLRFSQLPRFDSETEPNWLKYVRHGVFQLRKIEGVLSDFPCDVKHGFPTQEFVGNLLLVHLRRLFVVLTIASKRQERVPFSNIIKGMRNQLEHFRGNLSYQAIRELSVLVTTEMIGVLGRFVREQAHGVLVDLGISKPNLFPDILVFRQRMGEWCRQNLHDSVHGNPFHALRELFQRIERYRVVIADYDDILLHPRYFAVMKHFLSRAGDIYQACIRGSDVNNRLSDELRVFLNDCNEGVRKLMAHEMSEETGEYDLEFEGDRTDLLFVYGLYHDRFPPKFMTELETLSAALRVGGPAYLS